ncbi:STM4013/SEN3800 family hydrolase [Nostoc sp. 'Peltigera membranacea cyanobiont' N6]|uniref:STM4013/SEN3800 family hydrolase n=1 Tax=Nostoc sp. 'Peltigera membranacea cyanobiont' N6 TaxID=1261031 RepID=UPI000CF30F38|nr:STM4013/SEN3800 family hydrolase [Nostoc sp. 'Peltigera membranacea cyanobiont' N6]AVH65275.1 sulfatase [Nostoc sp. 'Peltigera membranacea cyanobiont' N6]
MFNINEIVGTHDILFITLDTLRYDIAKNLLAEKRTPNLAKLLPKTGWEERHSPGNFTYASHHAFFAGFLPTPVTPGIHPRLFALGFEGSTTTTDTTCVLDSSNIVNGLAAKGYHTVCIGGVGFLNKRNPLGNVIPSMFAESYWSPELGVTNPESTENQVNLARQILEQTPNNQRIFLFINISALHQPNYFYLPDAKDKIDTIESHAAALEYVDRQLAKLWNIIRQRHSTFCILCSDHGTTYGEDGYTGHRLSHPVVWTVPYAEFIV